MNGKAGKRGGMYVVDEKFYPSVTQILGILDKPALRYWYGREVYRAMVIDPTLSEQAALAAPYKISEDAKNRGSAVHSIVEAWENTMEIVGMSGPHSGYANAFRDWVNSNEVILVEHERTVVSKKHRYAGTLDLIVKLHGSEPMVIDVKTGKDLYPEVHLQLSAYRHALNEQGMKVQKTGALLLKEDGTYKFETGKDRFKEFLACKYIWEGLNEDMLKKLDNKVQEDVGLFEEL